MPLLHCFIFILVLLQLDSIWDTIRSIPVTQINCYVGFHVCCVLKSICLNAHQHHLFLFSNILNGEFSATYRFRHHF